MAQRVVLSSLLCSLILLNYTAFSFAAFKQFAAPQISVPGCVDLALSFSLFCSPFDRFASATRTLSHSFLRACTSRFRTSLLVSLSGFWSGLGESNFLVTVEGRTQLPVGGHIIWSKREELMFLQRKKNSSNILIWVVAFWGFHL